MLYVLYVTQESVLPALKPGASDARFSAGLLTGLESCHRIGCGSAVSFAANTVTRF